MTIFLALVLAQTPAVAAPAPTREQIACAPINLPGKPLAAIRVIGSYERGRIMFGPGEALVINAGSAQGIQPGQRYFVRRYVNDNFTPASIDFVPNSVHTAGWVTIVETKADMAVATVTHACDGILDGDYLEPYVDPVVPPAALGGAPDFGHPGRLVLADEKRQTGSAGSLFLLNRGSDHDVRAGQTITIYRETMEGKGPILDVARATVLNVRPNTSLVRIDSSRRAVYVGDLAAIHRIVP
jgi:hypothetical protein